MKTGQIDLVSPTLVTETSGQRGIYGRIGYAGSKKRAMLGGQTRRAVAFYGGVLLYNPLVVIVFHPKRGCLPPQEEWLIVVCRHMGQEVSEFKELL